ncbi:MAG TPA: hypothetical protein VHP35_09640, partial [Terriglobia bacterium]|nr:hypothetical protein [Terriglobia bacterium]
SKKRILRSEAARRKAIDHSVVLILESRELIKKSEALLQECQQSETPRFTYLRLHFKRAWWQSSPPLLFNSSDAWRS